MPINISKARLKIGCVYGCVYWLLSWIGNQNRAGPVSARAVAVTLHTKTVLNHAEPYCVNRIYGKSQGRRHWEGFRG